MRGLAALWNALERALSEDEGKIVSHIEQVYAQKRRTGIERIFAESFEARLAEEDLRSEVSGQDLDVIAQFPGRAKARVDSYVPSLDLALEYKAGRLPRNYGNEFFDISQVGSDIIRLRSAKVQYAFVIVFVYGPLVAGTTSVNQLYRAFHDSYFLDFERGKRLALSDEGQQRALDVHRARVKLLGWDRPWTNRALPLGCIVKRTEQLGAICLDCQPGTKIPKACIWGEV